MKWIAGMPPKVMYAEYLVKYNYKGHPGYYVIKWDWVNDKFVEALGEQYEEFTSNEVIAYTTFDELNEDFRKYSLGILDNN